MASFAGEGAIGAVTGLTNAGAVMGSAAGNAAGVLTGAATGVAGASFVDTEGAGTAGAAVEADVVSMSSRGASRTGATGAGPEEACCPSSRPRTT